MSSSLNLVMPEYIERRVQLRSLVRELQEMESQLSTSNARGAGSVKASPQLTDLAHVNGIDLKKKDARVALVDKLETAFTHYPSITLQFAAQPPSDVRKSIVEWLRTEIDPRVLIDIRLRPTLGGGFVVRTPNHQIDHSWRRYLDQKPTGFADFLRRSADV